MGTVGAGIATVNRGCGQKLLAVLNDFQISATFEEVRGARMAE